MKKFLAATLAAIMVAALLSACTGGEATGPAANGTTPPPATSGDGGGTDNSSTPPPADSGGGTINVWGFTDEVPQMTKNYVARNPQWGYTIKETIIATDSGAGGGYQMSLDQALLAGGDSAPDLYVAEEAFVLKYSSGSASQFAAKYKDLGIDIDAQLAAAQIATYASEIGTRDGEIVALPYQATGGAFIYRRSIAKDVFGSDDPATIKGEIGPGLDKFFAAADKIKAKGYSTLSGPSDLWFLIRRGSEKPYIVDGKFVLDSYRESFLDYAKLMKDNDYTNQNAGWGEGWTGDMGGLGARQVFGYFGPAWLINYVMSGNSQPEGAEGTFGDWAVCEPPVGFSWGGTWVFANKDTKVAGGVKDLVEWITLDTSDTGLQYLWANGLIDTSDPTNLSPPVGTKDTVASGTVMAKSNGEVELLGGQNMFDIFIPAGNFARGDNLSEFDEGINTIVEDAAGQYAEGNMTRDEALALIKQKVQDTLGISS